ncbi:spore coat associated protein CotJA [Acutalibacter caecimuris]|uniref:spore coat associated protein CotJA n=1 Tax=Acutalibacter caecimuris TaxID=3093657 RepID=UPI002AC96622|nr:spore coat associated protein CotJA [Acutalibacter sp. M00118]
MLVMGTIPGTTHTTKKGANKMEKETIPAPCGEDPTPFPADAVPAMAYVPFQQWSSNLHSAERALDAGTLFPVLDKPFYGRRGEPR